MKHLVDFKPLQRIKLPDIGVIDSAGLTVIIGPNSSGKTRLLRDIEQRLAGEPHTLVVAQAVDIGKPDYEELVECLKREGYISEVRQPNGAVVLRSQTTFIGYSQQPLAEFDPNASAQWFAQYSAQPGRADYERSQFLMVFGRMLMTALFLDRRLVSLAQVNGFDRNAQAPQSDLHVLYYNHQAQDDLWDETTRVFSKAVWLDPTKPNILRFLAADGPPYPSDKDRRKADVMDEQREITQEGDGLKSYVATCIALLLGRRPVCLIDEPELCLHPPQAYNLGRFIGKTAASSDRATFVATHSSHVLRGVIQTASNLQIVRVTRQAGRFHAHHISPATLRAITKKPTVRAETILDGVFAEGVVVVEADGDREVYQAVWETLVTEMQLDIHFAAVGGLGGVLDACKFYKELKIPLAVVVDLDAIKDADQLQRIAAVLSDEARASQLAKEAGAFMAKLKGLPPTISADDVKRRIADVGSLRMEWNQGDDLTVMRRLQDLAGDVDRMRRIKAGGVAAMPLEIETELSALINNARSIGVFLVPVGELEGWLTSEGIAVSKQTKWAWAIEAAAKVRELGAQKRDIWNFMRKVGAKLKTSRNTD
ncbi:MAG: AAA family ATPase [Burkholderiales bacterium]